MRIHATFIMGIVSSPLSFPHTISSHISSSYSIVVIFNIKTEIKI